MKLAPRDVGAWLRTPEKQHRAALVYGPDAGLIGERGKQIAKAVLGEGDAFGLKELTEAQLKDDGALLMDELCAYSLMGGKRLVLLRDGGDKSTKLLEEALALSEPQAYLLVLSDDLGPRSSLRLLFEKHPQTVAIACYKDDERDIAAMVQETLRSRGIQYDNDVIPYLTRSLGNDRRVTLNEIDKILLYLGDEKRLTLEIAAELVANNQEVGMDDVCQAVAGGEVAKLDRALESLFRENTQPVMILRMVQNYFQRLHQVQSKLAAGESLERVMMQLRPPVFYKHQSAFTRHVKRWESGKALGAMEQLFLAEKSVKSSAAAPNLLCAHALTELALKAA